MNHITNNLDKEKRETEPLKQDNSEGQEVWKEQGAVRKRDIIRELKIHTILLYLAAVMLVVGIMNWHGSLITKDYRCLEGRVINVEAVRVLQKGGYVTRYNYTIVWYDNNIRHEQNVYKVIDRPDESQTKVWVNADNTDAILSDSTSARKLAYEDFGIAVITFILGMLLMPRGNKKKKLSVKELESKYTGAILMVFTMGFADLLMIYIYYLTRSKDVYVSPMLWDVVVVINIILAMAIVNVIRLKKKLK